MSAATTTTMRGEDGVEDRVSRYGCAGSGSSGSDRSRRIIAAPHLGLDRGDQRPVANRRRDRLDVAGERPVVAEARRERAHERVRRADARARLERREELDALRTGEQLDRERPLGVREHLPRLQAGRVPHRDVILLAGARRDRVDAGRVAEHLVLADERRGDVLRDHEAGVEPAVGRQERRQPVGEGRVDEPLDAALGDARELGDRHRQRVERERERLAVEVAVRDEQLVLDEHERVVGGRVQLDARPCRST